jgi:hypothetical protein
MNGSVEAAMNVAEGLPAGGFWKRKNRRRREPSAVV